MSELRTIQAGFDAKRSKQAEVEKRISNLVAMVEVAEGDSKNLGLFQKKLIVVYPEGMPRDPQEIAQRAVNDLSRTFPQGTVERRWLESYLERRIRYGSRSISRACA